MTTGIKNDSGKRQWWYMDSFWEDLGEVVDVLSYGDTKYPADDGANWKRLPDAEKRFKDALFRHLVAYRLGEKTDTETGKPHLAHLITNALILMYFDRHKQQADFDNRTLEKIKELVLDIYDSVHPSNSPYSNNEQIVHPYLEAVIDEIDNLKGNP